MLKRAQAWGFDLIIGVMVFLAGMILFFLFILNLPSEQDEIFNVMSYEGKLIGNGLFSEGFPNNWNEGNVITIGIFSDGRVNNTKLKNFYNFANADYQKSKRLFNVLNDYYVFFEEPIVVEGAIIDGIGYQPINQKNLVRISRVVVHENKIKDLHIYIWN